VTGDRWRARRLVLPDAAIDPAERHIQLVHGALDDRRWAQFRGDVFPVVDDRFEEGRISAETYRRLGDLFS
jgi:hypothetical protein